MVLYEKIRTHFEAFSTIWCICHTNPDGDALGSLLGMFALLQQQYPSKTIKAFCKDIVPEQFRYLPLYTNIQHECTAVPNDLLVFVDCAVPKQTGLFEEFPEYFTSQYTSICIDHHVSNSFYATETVLDTSSASACEIIFDIAKQLEWKVDSAIATLLLTGLLTDTGCFLHSNTNSHSYRTAATLLRLQANHSTIVRDVFRSTKISTLRLWGRVLEKMHITSDGAVVSAVTTNDFLASRADYSELNGAIDYLNSVPGMRFSLLLAEKDTQTIKGSLRTLRPDVDVSQLASKFDGGGHKAAAGFTIPGTLESHTTWQIRPHTT